MIKIESNYDYHSSAPLSKSRLWNMSRSPEWFKWCEDHPEEARKSEAFAFGSAFHKLVLEPDGFFKEFAIMPSIDRRTKAGKAQYADFELANSGKEIVTAEMVETAEAMRDKVRGNKYSDFLTKGNVEQSFYFTDQMTGIELKVRPDCWKDTGDRIVIADLKSCRDASMEGFRRDAIQYGYDVQAAMYIEGVKQEFSKECDFIFVAVEKEPPHLLNILQCDAGMLLRGKDLFRLYLGMYDECQKTGNWYGYTGAQGGINELDLPAYLKKDYE